MQNKPRLIPLLLKTALLFVVFNFVFILTHNIPLGKLSLYNIIFPGRERLPFGEAREAYNISMLDLDALFASHVLAGTKKTPNEYRVFLIGDSSVWGTLLTPDQTLAGQLNAKAMQACGKNVKVYNLGYPYISLLQELMIFDQGLQYKPDLIIWLTTLESLPNDKQFSAPLVASNPDRARALIKKYNLALDPNDPALKQISQLDQAFMSQRRSLADLIRLQIDGVLWSSTGIDQIYPKDYEHAQIDLDPNTDFHGLISLDNALAFDVLDAGMSSSIPSMLVNEPILISNGKNSDIRYNFFYPRWAYDEYRDLLAKHAADHHWHYLDEWDLVPLTEFTNSGVHLTPYGESLLAEKIAAEIQTMCK